MSRTIKDMPGYVKSSKEENIYYDFRNVTFSDLNELQKFFSKKNKKKNKAKQERQRSRNQIKTILKQINTEGETFEP